MSNKGVLALLVGLAVLLGIILLCPAKQSHRNAVVSQLEESIKNDSTMVDVGNATSIALVSRIVESIIDSQLHFHNYGVFSLGTIKSNNEEVVISIGFLHHVYCTFDRDKLENFITSVATGTEDIN
jgi:hypothetical protein